MNTSLITELERRDREFRTLLRHLLDLKTGDGRSLISAELFAQQVIEDCEAAHGGCSCSVHELLAWARSDGPCIVSGGNFTLLFSTVHLLYRRLVCGLDQPEWLCAKASPPALLHPDFPVYYTDRLGGKDYVFAIQPLPAHSNSRVELRPKHR